MFTLVFKIFATWLFCSFVILPIQIFARDTVNSEIMDRNGKTPYATYNSCGGEIETICEELIVIDYKSNEEYENNELCVWVIRTKECLRTLITKTKSGFEAGYDYLQISGFEVSTTIGNGPSYTEKLGSISTIEQINKRAHVSYLIFSSDGSNTGSGFRIEIVGWPPESYPLWSEDFFSTSPSGTTTIRPYPSLMMQSFVIAPKHTSVPSLRMDIEYNTGLYDYLAVFTLERNGQSINFRPHSRWLNGTGIASFETVYYTNFVILFYSNTANGGPNGGVTLTWAEPKDIPTTENYM